VFLRRLQQGFAFQQHKMRRQLLCPAVLGSSFRPASHQGVIRLAIGGDSRDDKSHVVSWAFTEARKRGAKAFFFLADLELSEALDYRFSVRDLGDIPFYRAMGNHEVEIFGLIRGRNSESLEKVKKFREKFLATHAEVHLAPLPDTVLYSVDLDGGIHFIALDNVSRKGEGFGTEQLGWLEQDLKTASTAGKVILVGMHKGLANNQYVSSHTPRKSANPKH
jgi:hypothetical protein